MHRPKNKHTKHCYILFFVITIFTIQCTSDESEPVTPPASRDCSTTPSTFADANAVISTSCATNSNCHASGSNNRPEELLTYDQIFSFRNAIRSAVASGSMPQGSRLSTAQKNSIICWIENGAPNN